MTPTTPPLHGIRPLTDCMAGERVRCTRLNAGHRARSRLTAMGVVPGAVLEILRQNGRGPVLIALGESRFALGRGIAEKILVEPAHP